jgi:hypothetical protein
MWPQLLASIFGIIDKVIPDPQAAAQAKIIAMQLQDGKEGRELEASVKLALAQTDIDKIEAQSDSIFKSGWRPFTGWSAAIGVTTATVWAPLGAWAWSAASGHALPALPVLDSATLFTLLASLLGLGTLRTVDKIKGTV